METKIFDRKKRVYIFEKDNMFVKFLYKTAIGRMITKILKMQFFSKISAVYMNSSASKVMIKKFAKKNNIIDENIKNYSCFNDFFSRKRSNIEFSKDEKDLISIAQARLMCCKISQNLKISVKDSIYSIEELIKNPKKASEYKNGMCLIFRLVPSDYHRYIYIDKGTQKYHKKIKGFLHTVKPIAYSNYKVYKENCREYSVLDTINLGEIIQIEVGAMLVGRIVNHNKKEFERGEEKGYFQFRRFNCNFINKKRCSKNRRRRNKNV